MRFINMKGDILDDWDMIARSRKWSSVGDLKSTVCHSHTYESE